jgi:hypothetical protein
LRADFRLQPGLSFGWRRAYALSQFSVWSR